MQQPILKNLIVLAGCLLIAASAAAQRYVSGKVLDADNGPLAGATVFVKENRAIGMTTDAEGNYRLRLPDGKAYTLQASFIGYVTQSHALQPGQDRLDFALEEDAIGMETVVVTGTRTPKLLKDVPIVTRVITADDIRKVDATHIGDLLQAELPGIEFSYSMDQQTSLNMQGFGGNAVLFLVDGERLAGETLDNIDYSRLNLDNVERIEIVKGAASSLYGSNAVGGVVNLITKEATEPWTLNLNGKYGAHNDQRYGGTFTFRAGDFQNSLNVQHTSTDPIEVGTVGKDGEENDFSRVYGNRTWNFKERLVYTPTDRLKLTGRLGYFFRERDKSTSSKDRYRDFSGGLRSNYTFNKRSDLELSYSFDQYDKSDYDPAQDYDLRDYTNVQHTVRALYNYAMNDKNTLTVGGDFMRDYLMSYQFTDNGDHEQYTADAFAQFDLNPIRNLNVMSSIRFDYYSEADVETRHHVQMAQLLAPRLLRRRIPRPHAEGNVHGLQHGERLHDIRQREPETRKQPELLALRRIPEEPLQCHPDRIFQPGGQPHHYRVGPEPQRNGLLQHRPDEHRRAKRRRSRQVSLRLGRAPLVCLHPRAHPRRRALLLVHPSPFRHRQAGLRQAVEKLRFRRDVDRPRPLARHHGRIRELYRPRRRHHLDHLSGIHPVEAEPCAARVPGHPRERSGGQPVQLPPRPLLQQHAHHHRHHRFRGAFARREPAVLTEKASEHVQNAI